MSNQKKKNAFDASALTKEELIKKFRRQEQDTGSPEVQVALMTGRIQSITQHLMTHAKDFHSRRGLVQLVSNRRKLLDFLKEKNVARYTALTQTLGLRR